jgi:tetratricopeptide (TPR) repeat protein
VKDDGRPSAERMTIRERRSDADDLRVHAVPEDGPATVKMEPGEVDTRPPKMPASHNRQRGEFIGRYVLISPLGVGGMGEVYTAYDPSLDRRIALKVIKPVVSDGELLGARALLVAEAHALAKLSHPNVVAVYDVGTDADDVYVAMEYVEGTTLTAWLGEARPWPEVIDLFVAAGRGLAAAHAAGLVHRDFKPDNVLIGTDGRVRVIDFGIALATKGKRAGEMPQDKSIVGTPSFMAPEQFEAGNVGPHSDQFSFAVALYQALWRAWPFPGDNDFMVRENVLEGRLLDPPESGVPPPVRDAVLRALSRDPAKRFPSMTELLAALQPPPPRRVAPYIIAAFVMIAVVATGVVALAVTSRSSDQLCTGFSRDLAGIWDPARKQVVRRAVDPDAWPSIERVFDGYAADLVEHKAAVCRATSVTGEQTPAVMERRMACLDTRRRELDAAVALVAAGGAPSGQAVEIAGGLHTIAGCDNLASLKPLPDAPIDEIHAIEDGLAKARALRLGGDYREARTLSADALAGAEKLAWGSGVARALVERGLSESADGDPKAARETLFEAIRQADDVDDPGSKAAAWIGLVFVEAVGMRAPTEALRWAKHAEGALTKAGSDQDSQGTLLHNIAAALHSLDRDAEALDHEQRALVLYEHAFGPRHFRVASQRGVVAQALRRVDKLADALREGEASVAQLEELLGKNHKTLAPMLNNLAVTYDELGRLDDARTALERALAIKVHELGPTHVSLGIPLSNLAALERRLGHFDVADTLLQRAYEIRVAALGVAHPDVTRILQTKLLDRLSRGLDDEARALVDDVITRQKARTDSTEIATALSMRCELERRAGRLEAATATCADAIIALGKTPDTNRATYIYAYAARVAADRKQLGEAAALLDRARTLVVGVTREKEVARGYVGWAGAYVASAAGRRDESLALAKEARDILVAHGHETPYLVEDLGRLK